MHFQVIPVQYSTNNSRQNQLRLFSLKCPSEDLQVTKGKYSFPSPQMHCCAAVQATCKKTFKTATLNGGKDCGLFCSPNLPQMRTMSQQFCHQLKVDSEAPLFLFSLLQGERKFWFNVRADYLQHQIHNPPVAINLVLFLHKEKKSFFHKNV